MNIRGNIYCAIAIIMFAVGFPAADQLLQTWGVIALISVRNFMALLTAVLLMILLERNGPFLKLPWIKGFWIGGAGFGCGSLLLLIALSMTDAMTAALAAAAMPVFAVGLEVLLDSRRLSFRFLVAVALVLLGGALASGVMPGRLSIGSGFALGLLASGIFAWGSRATVKSFPELSPLSRTAITTSGMFGFTAIAWVAALLVGHSWAVAGSLNLTDMGLLVVYGCLGLGVSQIFWIRAVSDVGIGIASFHLNATPFYVMIIVFFLGSDWDWLQTGGVVILTIGAVLAQLPEQLPRRSVLGTVTKI